MWEKWILWTLSIGLHKLRKSESGSLCPALPSMWLLLFSSCYIDVFPRLNTDWWIAWEMLHFRKVFCSVPHSLRCSLVCSLSKEEESLQQFDTGECLEWAIWSVHLLSLCWVQCIKETLCWKGYSHKWFICGSQKHGTYGLMLFCCSFAPQSHTNVSVAVEVRETERSVLSRERDSEMSSTVALVCVKSGLIMQKVEFFWVIIRYIDCRWSMDNIFCTGFLCF